MSTGTRRRHGHLKASDFGNGISMAPPLLDRDLEMMAAFSNSMPRQLGTVLLCRVLCQQHESTSYETVSDVAEALI